jgi:hypothetical protein
MGCLFLNSFCNGRAEQMALELEMPNRRKQKPVPGGTWDFLNLYRPDGSAKIAYEYPRGWTSEDKQNFCPSMLPKNCITDDASSVIWNGESFRVVSIPKTFQPEKRGPKAKEIIQGKPNV